MELHGDGYHEAYLHARVLARKHRSTFVHPYDDPLVIAGQGTVGLEILRQHARPIDAIYVPVGGGGLIAGIAAYVKRVSPRTRVIGVEPVDSCAMFQSLEAGRRVTLAHVNLFADGVAVRQVGRETLDARAPLRGFDGARGYRRDLRGHQGHLRGHAHRARARGGAGARRRQARPRAAQVEGAHRSRGRLGRQHELRPPALRGRARGAGRSSARRCWR